ncbi:SDR family oxidoreductase [Kitasatospora sp. NBC_00315]|uniref:SDR family oxidoreductase n=1 Tax=Kitasatospora sp. NBC_00315 TaxID=2975963 RepID=UPI00324CCC4F
MADSPATKAPVDLSPVCRRLVGRTAVITGAGGGTGLAVARRLAAEGARVVCADLDEKAGRAAARAVGGLFVHTDVRDPAMVEALFDEAYETCGSVDVAVNHVTLPPPAHEAGGAPADGPAAWHRVQEATLTAVHLCCWAALPYMRRHGRGSIVNTVGFVARTEVAAAQIAYAAARGGVLAMSRELGVQFAREGIRVNALSPGPVGAPASGGLPAVDPAADARRPGWIPLGRLAAPEEIAAAAAFLASDDASFVTAGEFLVDGGISGAALTAR